MILVVQFREDVTEAHEQECVRRHLRNGEEARFVSIFDKSVPFNDPQMLLEGARKLIMGGSGALSFGEGHEYTDYEKADYVVKTIEPLIKYVIEHDFPTLGVCLGHQLLGQIAGEPITFEASMAETGFLEIQLTPEGQTDPVFEGFPPSFIAVVGHQDSLTKVPEGAVLLAKTDNCPVHCIRFGKNVYGTQFHSELNAKDLVFRMKMFPHYRAAAKDITVVPMPFAERVMANFLK